MLAVLVLLSLCGVVRSVRPALGYRCRRFRKEWKPRVSHAMHDTVVQRSIAEAVGLGVYYFSDDFKQVTGRRGGRGGLLAPPQERAYGTSLHPRIVTR